MTPFFFLLILHFEKQMQNIYALLHNKIKTQINFISYNSEN